ncbi:MAG TPA: hemerythrin domain-containing protein [Candidatus Sulfotelmatobacter sp.]|jgi:hemerythrin-like domain-containing protein|nr:hemerythrin domain-containing protein [Candidatus Sulfotelmatobacter sp.]
MKRHPSLHPLSQHHHFALIQALEMRRAAEAPVEKRGAAVARQAEKFVRFWHKSGQVHFREEEEVLLPAYARQARIDKDADVVRLLGDHAEIRAAVLDFEQRLAAKDEIQSEEIARVGKLLHDHVRLEENEVFPRIEKVLGEKRLNEMGRGLTRLHSKGEICDI